MRGFRCPAGRLLLPRSARSLGSRRTSERGRIPDRSQPEPHHASTRGSQTEEPKLQEYGSPKLSSIASGRIAAVSDKTKRSYPRMQPKANCHSPTPNSRATPKICLKPPDRGLPIYPLKISIRRTQAIRPSRERRAPLSRRSLRRRRKLGNTLQAITAQVRRNALTQKKS